ncbi:hypothetical protein BDR26DRAFT_834961 [Obelidium mucronatum]|nr:hypothetical protein BDR26DRAFT_834961 [Obelidium mucronatum]
MEFCHLLSAVATLRSVIYCSEFDPLVVVLDTQRKYPANIVKNQNYNVISFLPVVLYKQFKFFFNLYFLLIALSQFIPALKIGLLFSYVAPLVFVLLVTLGKKAADDYERMKRDAEANSAMYQRLSCLNRDENLGESDAEWVRSADLSVGDFVIIPKDQSVPADCILLRTTSDGGACFIRTDQLDGETDWKMRYFKKTIYAIVNGEMQNCRTLMPAAAE